jgi:hypothetical protein
MRKPTEQQLNAARANYRIFCARQPELAKKYDPLIEAAKLGDTPELIQHFAQTAEAPDYRALAARAMFPSMKKD